MLDFTKIEFEKNLSPELICAEYKSISIWSVIRLSVLDQVYQTKRGDIKNKLVSPKYWRKFLKGFEVVLSFIFFILTVLKSKNVRAIIRVNSFSILGEKDGQILFKNKNLQDIYNSYEKRECLVIINQLDDYRLKEKIVSGTLFTTKINIIFGIVLYILNKSVVDSKSLKFSRLLPLKSGFFKKVFTRQLASFYIWHTVYKFIKPSVIYYECPHFCFEAEIVAGKTNKIPTVEIYHGGVTLYEISYFQIHLNFNHLVHSVCDTYISPSQDQTEFISSINEKYTTVNTVKFKPTFLLSSKQKQQLNKCQNLVNLKKKNLLFIASIADGDIEDISEYITNNNLNNNDYSSILLRLHPDDSKSRWVSFMDTFKQVHYTNLSLTEDIMQAHVLVVLSSTVILQLRAHDINFINLCRAPI